MNRELLLSNTTEQNQAISKKRIKSYPVIQFTLLSVPYSVISVCDHGSPFFFNYRTTGNRSLPKSKPFRVLTIMDIVSLSNLLQENNEQEEQPSASHAFASATPSAPVVSKVPIGKNPDTYKEPAKEEKDEDDIWGEEEVADEEAFHELDKNDKRVEPKHQILYKQSVDSSDVYLGLGDKAPGSSDCDTLVVKVFFPRHKLSEITLDVKKNSLLAESKEYLLRIYLPQSVKEEEGKAKFDTDSYILSVELPILVNDW